MLSTFRRIKNYKFVRCLGEKINPLNQKTIYALSSAPGKSAVSVIRVSGPDATKIFTEMTESKTLPSARKAVLKKLLTPHSPEAESSVPIKHKVSPQILDNALCIFFPGPNSFTGDDVVELHVHGSTAVVKATLNALGDLSFTPAEPGEFTRRSFHNGKMDLTSVEALSDLINSETEHQRRQALHHLSGETGKLYDKWTNDLKRALSYVEAIIDFAEDEYLEVEVMKDVVPKLEKLRDTIESHLRDNRRGEILRSGVHITIAGPPNVGKSSLLNLLANRPAAIVSPHRGTTRDILEIRLDLGGYPIVVADTAGLNTEATDPVEQEGIRRARERFENSSIKIVMLDTDEVSIVDKEYDRQIKLIQMESNRNYSFKFSRDEKEIYDLLRKHIDNQTSVTRSIHYNEDQHIHSTTYLVLNKFDLLSEQMLVLTKIPFMMVVVNMFAYFLLLLVVTYIHTIHMMLCSVD
eukprot:TRINITY_DN6983_c0_g1_i1.p1 TRINITY_DN6983_c0_g1~~TRINITY_DN6983_c0_g1_i1.p1  ORF type:complete len:465 (+),score=50.18 TRINITY_DN6983_c0_g1_i1:60-1454(+)